MFISRCGWPPLPLYLLFLWYPIKVNSHFIQLCSAHTNIIVFTVVYSYNIWQCFFYLKVLQLFMLRWLIKHWMKVRRLSSLVKLLVVRFLRSVGTSMMFQWMKTTLWNIEYQRCHLILLPKIAHWKFWK